MSSATKTDAKPNGKLSPYHGPVTMIEFADQIVADSRKRGLGSTMISYQRWSLRFLIQDLGVQTTAQLDDGILRGAAGAPGGEVARCQTED